MRSMTGPELDRQAAERRFRAACARGLRRNGIGVCARGRHGAVPEIALVVVLEHWLAGKEREPRNEAGKANDCEEAQDVPLGRGGGADQRRQEETEYETRRDQRGNQRRHRHLGDVVGIAEACRQHGQRRGEGDDEQAEHRPACRHVVRAPREGRVEAYAVAAGDQLEPRGVTHLSLPGS